MTGGAFAIEARHLGVTLSGRSVIRDVSLALPAASFTVIIGPNGAGKTTLLRALAGLVPASGEIRIGGRSIGVLSHGERARAIAYLPQGHEVHWPLPARDVVALGRYPHGMRDPARLTARDAMSVERAMARAGVDPFADRPVHQLSGGERARVMLARVLAVEAPVVIADEPTAALDPRHQLRVMRDLRDEAARGALVIAATHDLSLAARLADRVILVAEGAIAACGAPDEVLTPERLARHYGIRAIRQRIGSEALLVPWDLEEPS